MTYLAALLIIKSIIKNYQIILKKISNIFTSLDEFALLLLYQLVQSILSNVKLLFLWQELKLGQDHLPYKPQDLGKITCQSVQHRNHLLAPELVLQLLTRKNNLEIFDLRISIHIICNLSLINQLTKQTKKIEQCTTIWARQILTRI